MDYVCPVKEVEQQLREVGERLAFPPSSTKELLDLLDKTEVLLTFVGQAPSIPMQGALVPSMGALIADELMKHSDVDVRVSVASCLCEISRITAPEPPYKDEIMKEIFHLNVTAFGELIDMGGRSYSKAVHILESVCKVKSCLLMLDLECNSLILDMFENFLNGIRRSHPHSVSWDMENIMTSVIEESDEVGTELLSLLISHVKKENQDNSPVSWELAEKVLLNCSDTLKPYSQKILKIIESDPDDYPEVVTTICQNSNLIEYVGHTPTKTNPTSTKTNHKRDVNTLENGNPTSGTHMNSQSKKQKYMETQKKIVRKLDTNSPKMDEKFLKNRLKGKELEPPQTLSPNYQSHSANGQLKNTKNNLIQDSREDLRRTRFQDKGSYSGGFSLKEKEKEKEKSKGTKGYTGNSEKKTTRSKGNIKNYGSLYSMAIKQEDEVLSDSGGAELKQLNGKLLNRKRSSSKKLVAHNGSHEKGLQDAKNLKKYGKELVGRRIKVWWPLDKMYYKGVVSSYDPLDQKHKVLYADGDEEVLDLSKEKWNLIDDVAPDQLLVKVADLPSPMITSSAKRLKQKGKRKIESPPPPPPPMQQDNSNLPKRPSPVNSSKTTPQKEHEITNNADENRKTDSVAKLIEKADEEQNLSKHVEEKEKESESGKREVKNWKNIGGKWSEV